MSTALEEARTTSPTGTNEIAHYVCLRCGEVDAVALCGTPLQMIDADDNDLDCVVCEELGEFPCPRCGWFGE